MPWCFIPPFNLVVFAIDCGLSRHIKNSSSDDPTNSCTIHEIFGCKRMTLKEKNNLFDY